MNITRKDGRATARSEQVRDLLHVEDLVDLNFGEDEPAPRIVFDEIGSQSPPTAEALQSLVQTKVIRPDDTLESFMRRRYGLPEADIDTAREVGAVPAGE